VGGRSSKKKTKKLKKSSGKYRKNWVKGKNGLAGGQRGGRRINWRQQNDRCSFKKLIKKSEKWTVKKGKTEGRAELKGLQRKGAAKEKRR